MSVYDVALVLGSGIKSNGELVESSKATVKKAVELLLNKKVSRIILSGKWDWSLNFTPPVTEGEAMAIYALKLGAPKNRIVTETTSVTTVSNLCNVKTDILEKNNWRSVILISNHPHQKRSKYNMDKVLGPDYITKVVTADFEYPQDIKEKLEIIELRKMQDAVNFYEGINDGDDKKILKLARKDLKDNYINQKKQF
jgi:uncharacterized SAM-binding protein YcdF (DUF218 family)